MGKVAKLIMVTSVNNNKYYDMEEVNGTIQVKYGRVGSTEQHASYPMHKWNSLLKSKLRKGYKDVTELRIVSKSIDFQDISNDEIGVIVSRLQSFANKSVSSNYTVSSDTAFMCLYDVHLGNWLHIKRHEGWMSQLTEKKLKAKGHYDSLYAEGGADLRNNEFIVYNECQCTPRYLVEFK